MTLLLLVLWGLAARHCALEQLPGFGFLACCTHPDKAPHEDNDCDQDGCAEIESSLYTLDVHTVSAPAPEITSLFLLAPPEPEAPDPDPNLERPALAPPDLLRIWQFYLRTALSPRAPSFVS